MVHYYPFVYLTDLTSRGPIAANFQKGAATVSWYVNVLLISPEEEEEEVCLLPRQNMC